MHAATAKLGHDLGFCAIDAGNGFAWLPEMLRLRRYLEGFIEAACLAVVALVPLVFNPLSMERFERDKQVVFRSLALLVLAAWAMLRSLEGPRTDAPTVLSFRSPVAGGLAALSLAVFLAAGFSVNPAASVWGAYANLQGVYSFLCGLVVAGAIAVYLPRAEQRERLQTVAIAGGFPVALYAILQRMGGDPFGPLFFSVGDLFRAQSTLGNPIYLGGYLVMIVPIGCRRIAELAHTLGQTTAGRARRIFAVIFYGLIVATQLIALLLSVSRGPFLGLLVALVFLWVLLALYRGWRRTAAIIACGSALLLAGLVLWGTQLGPATKDVTSSVAGRLASSLSPTETSGRAELWAEAPRLMLSRVPFRFPDRHPDRFYAMRPWVGYGPETLVGVLPRFFSAPHPAPVLETRFHNLIWDGWASIGGFGIGALLFVYLSVFFRAYRHLGWIRTWRHVAWYWFSLPALGAVGALALALFRGPAFAGVGLQVGLIFGTIVYPLLARPVSLLGGKSAVSDFGTGTLIIALMAAWAGHFAELAFAFETATTMALDSVFLGLLLSATSGFNALPSVKAAPAATHPDSRLRAKPTPRVLTPSTSGGWGVGPALISALLIVPLLYAFVSVYSEYSITARDVLTQMLLGIRGGQRVSFPVLPLILIVWIGSTFALTADWDLQRTGRPQVLSFWTCLSISGFIAISYAAVKAAEIAAVGTFPHSGASEVELIRQCQGYEKCYVVWLLFVLGLVLMCGFFLGGRERSTQCRFSAAGALGGLFVAGAAAFAIVRPNIDLIRADMGLRWATVTQTHDTGAASIAVLARAAKLAPGEGYYAAMWSQALRDFAPAAPDSATFASRMSQAEQALLAARRANPLTRSDYVLGTLYLDWALRSKNAQERGLLARKGREAFARAREFEPGLESAWFDSGNLEILLLDRPTGEQFQAMADRLVSKGFEGEYGLSYADRCMKADNPGLRELYMVRAGRLLDRAIGAGSPGDGRLFGWYMARGQLYRSVNHWDQALACFDAASQQAGVPLAWEAHLHAAEACWKLSQKAPAIQHLQTAIKGAPADQIPSLNQLMRGMLLSH